jgi:uncharacterized protein YijF (DUF1287 family)
VRTFVFFAVCLLALATQVVRAQPTSALDVARAARAQVGVTRDYDPSYVRMAYPGGDVPRDRGVCSDVVVRAYRAANVDFQKLLHEDMRANFSAYPHLWALRAADSNIDHRRVPNLQRFLQRKGKELPISDHPDDYMPGDIVSWRLPNGLAHIGIVSDQRVNSFEATPLVIHNVGRGAQEENVLFAWPQTGHYRWFAETESVRR